MKRIVSIKRIICIMLVVFMSINMCFNVFAGDIQIISDRENGLYNKYIFENGLLSKVCESNSVLIENYYYNGLRSEKIGKDKCFFTYDQEKNLISEKRGNMEITYIYEYDSLFKGNTIKGFILDGETYSYTRDDLHRISGIANGEQQVIAKYIYGNNTNKVEMVLRKNGEKWEGCSDKDFIGNVNKIRNLCAYYDEESGLYYENGIFYDAVTNEVIINKYYNKDVSLLSYRDDLDAILSDWQQSLLNDEWFNSAAPYTSTWYEGLSDVEVIARVIYGENTNVSKDQDAIAWVIRNRATQWNCSAREVVLENYQFSAAGVPNEPAYNTIKAQNSGEIGWANAVYMACLICYTLDEYDWNVLGAKPSGMENQMYYRAWYCYDSFSGQNPMYYDGTAVYNVYIAGYGYINSYNELVGIISNYSDRNIYFSY